MYSNEFTAEKAAYFYQQYRIQPAFSRSVMSIFEDLYVSGAEDLGGEAKCAAWCTTGNTNVTDLSKIGTKVNIPLRFAVNNVQRMILNTSGNLGVNVASPAYRVCIGGDLNFQENNSVIRIYGDGGDAGQVLTRVGSTMAWADPAGGGNDDGFHWDLLGNSDTDPAVNFIGTTDLATVKFRMDNIHVGALDKEFASFGLNSLESQTTGHYNYAFGKNALRYTTTGNQNSAFGSDALRYNTIGWANTAIGMNSMEDNVSGSYNTAVGNFSLANNTTGANNVAVGGSALNDNTVGEDNTAVGFQALSSNTWGVGNSAFGHNALRTAIASANSAFGRDALTSTTVGAQNVAVGHYSMKDNVTGIALKGYCILTKFLVCMPSICFA